MKRCKCELCVFTAKVAAIQKRLSKEDAAVIEELLIKEANASMDAAYYKAKFEGTWPEAA